MKKHFYIWSFLSAFSILCLGTIYCESLLAEGSYSYRWNINGNQHKGTLEYNVSNMHINGRIYGQPIKGYQVGRHVVFYRYSPDNQIWAGWISVGGQQICGLFSHQGENTYPWQGEKVR